MTMIERVARAIATAEWKVNGDERFNANDAYDLTNNSGRFEFDEMARAAIRAMHLPSYEMIEARYQVESRGGRFEYEDMIDAALSETSEEKA